MRQANNRCLCLWQTVAESHWWQGVTGSDVASHRVSPHILRILAELGAIRSAGRQNGNGVVGEVQLAVRMPPIGWPLRDLLGRWRERHPDVVLTVSEMSDWEIQAAICERRIDVALMTHHTLSPDAASALLYRERLVAALPSEHPLTERETLDWVCVRKEILLVQGRDNSQSAREFYTTLMGYGGRFHTHAAGKQSIFALVGAGFGITLATKSQSEVEFPGVTYRPISEDNSWVQVELAWSPEAEDPAVGRFVAYMRDEARSHHLF